MVKGRDDIRTEATCTYVHEAVWNLSWTLISCNVDTLLLFLIKFVKWIEGVNDTSDVFVAINNTCITDKSLQEEFMDKLESLLSFPLPKGFLQSSIPSMSSSEHEMWNSQGNS
jgi:hypothetical protein